MQSDIVVFFETQGDYLALAVAALGLLALIALQLHRYRKPAELSPLVWVIVGAVLCGGWGVVQRAGEHARQERIAQVSALGPTYAYVWRGWAMHA